MGAIYNLQALLYWNSCKWLRARFLIYTTVLAVISTVAKWPSLLGRKDRIHPEQMNLQRTLIPLREESYLLLSATKKKLQALSSRSCGAWLPLWWLRLFLGIPAHCPGFARSGLGSTHANHWVSRTGRPTNASKLVDGGTAAPPPPAQGCEDTEEVKAWRTQVRGSGDGWTPACLIPS